MIDSRGSAPGKRSTRLVPIRFDVAGPEPPKTISPLATMLRIVVPESRLSRPFAPFQRRPFERSQIPQPGKIPSPGARLGELLFESLTFHTA
jgi:hypothetical protein